MSANETSSYLEVKVEVPSRHVDAACDYIIENICSGMVIEEEEGNSNVCVIFYVPNTQKPDFVDSLRQYLSGLLTSEEGELQPFRQRLIRDEDWIEKYKASVQPVMIGPDIYIRPGWHKADQAARFDIIIEPKMAFGTGAHETTRSTLLAIRDNFREGMRFLDLGCGSGVLSILSAKMGASFIKAIDYDITAVENCRENFDVNDVQVEHEILFGSIDKCKDDSPYDFVCANIIKSTILPILDRLLALTVDNGFLILSGLLDQDEEQVNEALRKAGRTDYSVRRMNKWLTYTIRKS